MEKGDKVIYIGRNMDFKVGDRIIYDCGFDPRLNRNSGTVIRSRRHVTTIEFDKHINGHSGGTGGKKGHCWHVNPRFLLLIRFLPRKHIKKHKLSQ